MFNNYTKQDPPEMWEIVTVILVIIALAVFVLPAVWKM
jgi:hypothetical protein